jgi:hypothetical protein
MIRPGSGGQGNRGELSPDCYQRRLISDDLEGNQFFSLSSLSSSGNTVYERRFRKVFFERENEALIRSRSCREVHIPLRE